MERAVEVKYAGFVLMEDGVLLLFEDVPEDTPFSPVVYESYSDEVKGIRIGPLHATVPAHVFKFLFENPKIYVGQVAKGGELIVGRTLIVVDNLSREALFEVL